MSKPKYWKPLNTRAIINNLKRIFKTRNIDLLTKPTYKFLYLTSGFIAHMDINGFKCVYSNVYDLIEQLKKSDDIKHPNYYLGGFFQKEEHSRDYYTSKTETYLQLKELLEKY